MIKFFIIFFICISLNALELDIEIKKLDNEYSINNDISLNEYNKSLENNKKSYILKLNELQKKFMENGNVEGVIIINEKIKNLDVEKTTLIDKIVVDLAKSNNKRIGKWVVNSNEYNGMLFNKEDKNGEIIFAVNIPSDGEWSLEVEYASLEVRPVTIEFDNLKFESVLYRNTGSFDGTKTKKESFKVNVKRGLKVLKITHKLNPAPHIKSIILIKN